MTIPMLKTQQELQNDYVEALRLLIPVFMASANGEKIDQTIVKQASDVFGLPSLLYQPDQKLRDRINDYNAWLVSRSGEDEGKLMEEIALLSLMCLKGWQRIASHRSFDAQLDLVISGSDDFQWWLLMFYLSLPVQGRTIVVEAKNTDSPVSNSQFLRLCGIVQNKLEGQCHLGIFYTREGATGFDKKLSLADARATQVLFHAGNKNKYIIVLDNRDLQELIQEGALPRILDSKIREVEEAKGIPIEHDEDWKIVALPPHLARHLEHNEAHVDHSET